MHIFFSRDEQFDDNEDAKGWDFPTIREKEPATRGALPNMENSQSPALLSSVAVINHTEEARTPSPIGNGQQEERYFQRESEKELERRRRVEQDRAEEEKENKLVDSFKGENPSRHSAESNRLSNGIDSKPPSSDPMAVISNHSPHTSMFTADDGHPSTTLGTDLSSTLQNGLGPLSAEQEVATSGEPSHDVLVGDSHRHDSISEHTRELDDYLKRSSAISVLSDTQEENAMYRGEFERVGGGSSSGSDEESGSRGISAVSK